MSFFKDIKKGLKREPRYYNKTFIDKIERKTQR